MNGNDVNFWQTLRSIPLRAALLVLALALFPGLHLDASSFGLPFTVFALPPAWLPSDRPPFWLPFCGNISVWLIVFWRLGAAKVVNQRALRATLNVTIVLTIFGILVAFLYPLGLAFNPVSGSGFPLLLTLVLLPILFLFGAIPGIQRTPRDFLTVFGEDTLIFVCRSALVLLAIALTALAYAFFRSRTETTK